MKYLILLLLLPGCASTPKPYPEWRDWRTPSRLEAYARISSCMEKHAQTHVECVYANWNWSEPFRIDLKDHAEMLKHAGDPQEPVPETMEFIEQEPEVIDGDEGIPQ